MKKFIKLHFFISFLIIFIFSFPLNTIAADPCTEADWSYTYGECQEDGTRIKSWTKETDCDESTGVDHPATEEETCTYNPPTPTCTENDWSYEDGDCQEDGMKTRTWTKEEDCSGGVSHPETEEIDCDYTAECTEDDWESEDSDCEPTGKMTRAWTKTGECEGGVEHPDEEEVDCDFEEADSLDNINVIAGETIKVENPLNDIKSISVTFNKDIEEGKIDYDTISESKLHGDLPEGRSLVNLELKYTNVKKEDIDLKIEFKVDKKKAENFENLKAYYFNSPAEEISLTKVGSDDNDNNLYKVEVKGVSQISIVGIGDDSNYLWLYIIIGLLLVAAIAGGITFFIIKKKKVKKKKLLPKDTLKKPDQAETVTEMDNDKERKTQVQKEEQKQQLKESPKKPKKIKADPQKAFLRSLKDNKFTNEIENDGKPNIFAKK